MKSITRRNPKSLNRVGNNYKKNKIMSTFVPMPDEKDFLSYLLGDVFKKMTNGGDPKMLGPNNFIAWEPVAVVMDPEAFDYALKGFFDEAKKEAWFSNTIFVMVADHGNQIFYDEFRKPINRFAVPILIYQPNSKYVGVDTDLAQQIDIYPTILDMIGYEKPFRSWGRSLLDKKSSTPFLINSTGSIYQFAKGNYICTFDGNVALGFYDKNDLGLKTNLIKNRNAEMNAIELN